MEFLILTQPEGNNTEQKLPIPFNNFVFQENTNNIHNFVGTLCPILGLWGLELYILKIRDLCRLPMGIVWVKNTCAAHQTKTTKHTKQ